MTRRVRACCILVLVPVLLAGCAVSTVTAGPASPTSAGVPASAGVGARLVCVQATCAAERVQVFVEPDAGEAPVVQAIHAASRSVWVEVYLLTDRNVVHAPEDAAVRGVDVRVLLEPHPFGGGDVSAQVTLDELNAAGAQARASDPAYHYTHAKFMVVEGTSAYQCLRLSVPAFRRRNKRGSPLRSTAVPITSGSSEALAGWISLLA